MYNVAILTMCERSPRQVSQAPPGQAKDGGAGTFLLPNIVSERRLKVKSFEVSKRPPLFSERLLRLELDMEEHLCYIIYRQLHVVWVLSAHSQKWALNVGCRKGGASRA